ncbi:DUF421 domain-containing protein [Dactylosporangium sp. CA-139066]|uniref:DUF421 domain-containing protein n=1 Tax=Dactylosporangium sp. CA-139066 TaxID=3239930 RepID=UPI003D9285D4
MSSGVFGPVGALGVVALKALLLYVTAIVGFRLGERRTLAEMSGFDFVAAIAVGAIVGRVPNASDAGYLAGATTLVTVLVAHRIISRLRFMPLLARLIDREPLLLVVDGRLNDANLRRGGLTRRDLYGLLRRHGVHGLKDVRYVILEQRGQLSVVRHGGQTTPADSEVLRDITDRLPHPS